MSDTVRRDPMRNQWRPPEEAYAYIEEGYDTLAPTYDEEIGGNPIGERMREVFRKALESAFREGDFVVEIGCGTGIDALWLTRKGIQVVATDISGEMLQRLREKAKANGLNGRVRTRKLPAREIGALAEEFGPAAFDGAYCHAGALNMEPELPRLPVEVARLLKPDAPFVCSVINRTSLFELLFYPLVMRPRKAFRRLGNSIPIPISRRPPLNRYVVPSRFFTPRELVRLFQKEFVAERVQGLRIFLPPSNLAEEYAALKPAFGFLEFLENRLSGRRPFNSWGHHSILTFRRRP